MRKITFLFPFLFAILFLTSCKADKKTEEPMILEDNKIVSLPQPKTKGEISFEETVQQRRSQRSFSKQALTLEEVSQILWAAQGITDKEKNFRSAPSAGALYPLEIYLVVGEKGVEDLEPGVYHYNPEKHNIKKHKSGDIRINLTVAAFAQVWVKSAPVSLVISAVYERTTEKYGERGKQYVHMEAGHVGQNVYLQAESLNLGTVTIGAFSDNKVKQALNIEEEPLYIMPIGKPK